MADIATSEGGIKGLWSSFKVAAAGKTFLNEVDYSLHMTFDSYDKEVAHKALQVAREVCLERRGREIDNTLPTVFRAQPFAGVRTVLLGSDGEVWIPVHGFMPLSKAVEIVLKDKNVDTDTVNGAAISEARRLYGVIDAVNGQPFDVRNTSEFRQLDMLITEAGGYQKWTNAVADKV